jgi:hypothetical protein
MTVLRQLDTQHLNEAPKGKRLVNDYPTDRVSKSVTNSDGYAAIA